MYRLDVLLSQFGTSLLFHVPGAKGECTCLAREKTLLLRYSDAGRCPLKEGQYRSGAL